MRRHAHTYTYTHTHSLQHTHTLAHPRFSLPPQNRVTKAKTEHHANMEERVGYLETFLGESADKHEKELAEHKSGWTDHKVGICSATQKPSPVNNGLFLTQRSPI